MHLKKRITAAVLAAILGCTGLAGCSSEKTDSQPEKTTSVTETAETQAAEETQPEATRHISPMETVTSSLGTQVDVDAVLTREGDNTYKAGLSDFVESGDVIHSFTFVFHAADETSDIGTFQGGCGISVTKDCAAATDAYWYQSEDFSADTEGAYAEVTWNVPAEIQPDIDAGGQVLIGYWWGDTETVRLSEIICNYTRTAQIPVDGTETITVEKELIFGNEETESIKVSLGALLGETCIPQAVTFDIQADSSLGKFTGAFGLMAEKWHQSDTIAVLTDANTLSLTWIVPDSVKSEDPPFTEVMLGYWWGEASRILLKSVTVKYSVGADGTVPEKTDSDPENTGNGEGTALKSGAAAIAADIRAGWCLGNSLDCYDADKTVNDFETYWGNPKTTKEMIETVQAKGFNAVRIPVSWTNHISEDGTIDEEWMARVHEVVDYSMDCGMYTIVNVHHDDYTWINPTYADEAAVTEKFVKLWEQIAAEFKDYDTHLLFEGLNEPRVIGSDNEWMGGTPEERDVINHLLQKFVDTVRASGGRNGERTLIVTTHAASITREAVQDLIVPADDNIIVSIHNYAPWKFASLEYPDDKTFDDAGKAELDEQFDFLKTTFIDKGIPVIIGEFGAESKDNNGDRAAWASYYVSAAKQRGIPCFVWDNGPEDSYGLLNRKTCTWFEGGIADAITAAGRG